MSVCSAVTSSDCLLTQHAVPLGAEGDLCSSKGIPVAARGTCECFTGYNGAACEECAGGYQSLMGICQRSLDSILASGSPSSLSSQADAPNAPVSLYHVNFNFLDRGLPHLHARTGLPGWSHVPRDGALEGHSLWDFASITPLFYFIVFYR